MVLQSELRRVFNGYQLPELPFVNTGTQSQDTYKSLYKDWMHEQIAKDFSYEIEQFSYEF